MQPTVSVIIPTYNRGDFIRETVESVLAQTYTDFEIVIVDDGSTDQTSDVVAKLSGPIRYFFQTNQGRSVARNVGVGHSLGKYLLFLDSDDLLLPNSLATLTAVLDTRLDVGVVYSDGLYISAEGHVLERIDPHRPLANETKDDAFIQYQALCNVILVNHTAMVRRVWLDRVGPEYFDPTLSAAEDADFWLRVAVAGCKFQRISDLTAKYRFHTGNTYVGAPPIRGPHRESYIRSRLKIFHSDSFLKLLPKTQSDFLWGLLLDPTFGDTSLQPQIFEAAPFAQLPLDVQAQILYLSAVDHLVRRGRSSEACYRLARAAELQPRRLKFRLAFWLLKLGYPVFVALVKAQRRLRHQGSDGLPYSSQMPDRIAT